MKSIPLDKNESYWLLTEELVAACGAFKASELSTYPDYAELKSAIATYAHVDPSQVCITAGSDAIIENIARTLIPKSASVILPVPTFYGYENILSRAEVSVTPIFYTEENKAFVFPIDALLEEMDAPNVAAVFLCHPNNPLGPNIPKDDLSKVLKKAQEKNLLLVSDEAYFEYGGETLLGELADMPNLLIIRTFSKAFGLSGARVGYSLSSPELAEKLQKQLLPWPVSHLSSAAALSAIRNEEAFKERRAIYIQQRKKFQSDLENIPGITIYPSETNFLLLRVPDAEISRRRLSEAGTSVALGETMSRYPMAQNLLKSTLRVAIPSPEHLERVVESIREAVLTK